jgi:hypothetical protein
MTSPTRSTGPRGTTVLLSLLAWLVMYFGIRFFLEANVELPATMRLALSFVPTPIFAWFLWNFVRAIRGADELERRIQLEALAVAFPLACLLVTTLGLVQRAVTLNFQDWSYNHIWPMFALFYFVGILLARRRYQ